MQGQGNNETNSKQHFDCSQCFRGRSSSKKYSIHRTYHANLPTRL